MGKARPRLKRRQIVMIGGGFAGLTAARTLRNVDADITLIDRTNHHLFSLCSISRDGGACSERHPCSHQWLLGGSRTQPCFWRVCSIDAERKIVSWITRAGRFRMTISSSQRVTPRVFGHEEWSRSHRG